MILSLQYLRGIAALMVVAFHLCLKLNLTKDQLVWTEVGAAGVDIFFVISGFMMCLTTRKNTAIIDFYKKRVTRILPIYYLITTLVLILIMVAPSLADTTKIDFKHVLASYMFLAWPHPNAPTLMWPLLIPGWTLNYEMFFYFLVGLTLLHQSWRIGVLTVLILGLAVSGFIFEPEGMAQFYTSPLMLEFLAGYWLAYAYRQGGSVSTSFALALLVLSLSLFVTISPIISPAPWTRIVRWGIPAFLLVAALALLDRAKPFRLIPLGLLLGNASYSIYLVQFLGIPAFTMIWRLMKLPIGSAWAQGAFFLGSIIAVSVAGILVYRFIEVPLGKLLKRRPKTKDIVSISGGRG